MGWEELGCLGWWEEGGGGDLESGGHSQERTQRRISEGHELIPTLLEGVVRGHCLGESRWDCLEANRVA